MEKLCTLKYGNEFDGFNTIATGLSEKELPLKMAEYVEDKFGGKYGCYYRAYKWVDESTLIDFGSHKEFFKIITETTKGE